MTGIHEHVDSIPGLTGELPYAAGVPPKVNNNNKKKKKLGVPVMMPWKRIRLGNMRFWVRSLGLAQWVGDLVLP